MGVAFLVMFPVLYTDTTDTWRIVSRKQRMFVGAAGMITELYIALIATFLWSFLPDGIFKSIAFVFATTSWTLSLLVNTNALMRFDGYYILSDWWGIENLQDRSFQFGKWRLRELIFRLKLPMPERMDNSMAWRLTLYAWSVWVYRFFLFLGIALLVYHFFFKILGILLFAVEIIWFILFPISKELRVWWGMRDKIIYSSRFHILLGILAILFICLIIPINTTVSVPAILNARVETNIYSMVPARITSINLERDKLVNKGDVLLTLESPFLEKEIGRTISEIGLVSVRINRRVANPDDLAEGFILFETMQELQSKLQGFRELQEELTIRSPLSGKVVDIASNLHTGRWVNKELRLASVIDPSNIELSAIIQADKLSQIDVNQVAIFLPSNPELNEVKAQVVEIEDTNIQQLNELYFSSLYGGDIAVREDASGRQVPETSSYRIRLIPTENVESFKKVEVGHVYIQGKAKSIVKYLYETVASVLIRESGF
jgi:putative peptide zinc metalloprotease protein